MRPRDYLLILGMLAVLASAAIALLGHPSAAGELPPPASAEREPTPRAHGDVPEPELLTAAGGAVQKSEVAIADPVFRPSAGPDTAGWTSGMIVGDIPLTASILSSIQSISVVVDELKNIRTAGPPPFRRLRRRPPASWRRCRRPRWRRTRPRGD